MIRLRRFILLTLALIAVLVALGTVLGSYITSQVPEYRQDVEEALSDVFGRAVEIGEIRLAWKGVYPQAHVKQIVMPALDDEYSHPVAIQSLKITLDPLVLVQQEIKPLQVDIQGVQLHWELFREESERPITDLPAFRQALVTVTGRLSQLGDDLTVSVKDSNLLITSAKAADFRQKISNIDIQANVQNNEVNLVANADLPEDLGTQFTIDVNANTAKKIGSVVIDLDQLQAQSRLAKWLVQEWVRPIDGQVNLLAKMTWQAEKLNLTAELEARKLQYQVMTLVDAPVEADKPVQVFEGMDVTVNVEHRDDGWELSTSGLRLAITETPWLEGDIRLSGDQKGVISGKVDYARIDDVLPLVQPWLSSALPVIRGDLQDITFVYEPTLKEWSAAGNAKGLRIEDGEKNPGLDDLNGRLELKPDRGIFKFDSTDVLISEADWFVEPKLFKRLSGRLDWQLTTADVVDIYSSTTDTEIKKHWTFQLSDLHASSGLGSFAGDAIFTISSAGIDSRDKFELNFSFPDLSIPAIPSFIPARKFSDDMMRWWRGAMVAGTAAGTVKVTGLFSDVDSTAVELLANLQEADVLYHPDWPIAKEFNGEMKVLYSRDERSIDLQVDSLRWVQAQLNDVSIRLADLNDPYLDLSATAKGDLNTLLQSTAQSPVAKEVFTVLAANRYRGSAVTTIQARIPLAPDDVDTISSQSQSESQGMTDSDRLKNKQSPATFTVTTRLDNVDITEPDGSVYSALFGELSVNEKGLKSRNFRAVVEDIPLSIKLNQVFETQRVPTIAVQGSIDLSAPAEGYQTILELMDTLGVRHTLQGKIQWYADIAIDPDNPERVKTTIKSDMLGFEHSLAPPWQKFANQPRALTAVMRQTSKQQRSLVLRYENVLSARMQWLPESGSRTASELSRMALHLGDSQYLPPLPKQKQYVITGRLDVLDLNQFQFNQSPQSSVSATSQNAANEQSDIPVVVEQLRVDNLIAGELGLGSLDVSAYFQNDAWNADFTSPFAVGSANGVLASKPSISVTLNKLHLPANLLANDKNNQSVNTINNPADEPGNNSIYSQDSLTVEAGEAAKRPLRVDTFPLLNINAQEVKVGDFNFGAVAVTSKETPTGMTFDVFSVAPQLAEKNAANYEAMDGQLTAAIRWDSFDASTHVTDVQLDFSTDNIDQLLSSLGFQPHIAAQKGTVKTRLTWDQNPDVVSMGLLYGDLSFEFTDGVVQQVQPGLGRVLGLLNFYRLPERLTGDFRDIEEEGLAFDELSGKFHIANGNAYSSNMVLQSSIADGTFVGRIGLVAEDYDVYARIHPKVAGTVSLLGGVIGGFSTGGILLLVQGIFSGPLEDLIEIRYRLAGGWNDPIVDEVEIETTSE